MAMKFIIKCAIFICCVLGKPVPLTPLTKLVEETDDQCSFAKTANAAIRWHNTERLEDVSVLQCKDECCLRAWCKSFDYHARPREGNATDVCDLSNMTAADVGGLKTDYREDPYDHYHKNPDLCAGVVCNSLSQCHTAGNCNPSTGVCSNPFESNYTTCNDGDSNTGSDRCDGAGACAGTAARAPGRADPDRDPDHDPDRDPDPDDIVWKLIEEEEEGGMHLAGPFLAKPNEARDGFIALKDWFAAWMAGTPKATMEDDVEGLVEAYLSGGEFTNKVCNIANTLPGDYDGELLESSSVQAQQQKQKKPTTTKRGSRRILNAEAALGVGFLRKDDEAYSRKYFDWWVRETHVEGATFKDDVNPIIAGFMPGSFHDKVFTLLSGDKCFAILEGRRRRRRLLDSDDDDDSSLRSVKTLAQKKGRRLIEEGTTATAADCWGEECMTWFNTWVGAKSVSTSFKEDVEDFINSYFGQHLEQKICEAAHYHCGGEE